VYVFDLWIPTYRHVRGGAGEGIGAGKATEDPYTRAKEDPGGGRPVEAPIIGTTVEANLSRAKVATGGNSWGTALSLMAVVGGRNM
jgi:hypothetical protein